jgi:hypothetical protein
LGVTTTGNFNATISFVQLDSQNLSRISDVGSVSADISLPDGTGNQQINTIYHLSGVLPSGGSFTLDLLDLSRDIFQETVSVLFTKVKGIIIKNTSTTVGHNITVAATGLNSLTDLFNGGSGNFPVFPLGAFVQSKAIDGWSISPSNRYLSIIDSGGFGTGYEIAIVGNSG